MSEYIPVIVQVVILIGAIVGGLLQYRAKIREIEQRAEAAEAERRERAAEAERNLQAERDKLQAELQRITAQAAAASDDKSLAQLNVLITNWESEVKRVSEANEAIVEKLNAANSTINRNNARVALLTAHVAILTAHIRQLGGTPPPMPEELSTV